MMTNLNVALRVVEQIEADWACECLKIELDKHDSVVRDCGNGRPLLLIRIQI